MMNRRRFVMFSIAAMAAQKHLAAAGRDFWNRKPPSGWTADEIVRLLNDSPWAREITPVYTSPPPPNDHRPWGEQPPIGGGPVTRRDDRNTAKRRHAALLRGSGAELSRAAKKTPLPP